MTIRLTITLLFMALISLSAQTVSAGLLLTDNADPVEVRHLEVEINGTYQSDDEKSAGVLTSTSSAAADLTLTAGIAPCLDMAVVLPYTFDGHEEVDGKLTSRVEGFNDMTVDLKYQFLDLDGVRLALKAGGILPTGNSSDGLSDGRPGFGTKLIATKEFHEGTVAFHANAGYQQHDYRYSSVRESTRNQIYSFSAACEAQMSKRFKIALDSGLSTNPDKRSSTPPAYALAGAKYELGTAVEAYAGLEIGLTKPAADLIARYGFVLKF
jgi:hypothetical protein